MTIGGRIERWTKHVFGRAGWTRRERVMRLLEEVVELAFACGLERQQIERIVAFVANKEQKEIDPTVTRIPDRDAVEKHIEDETADVGVCLIAFVRCAGFDLEDLIEMRITQLDAQPTFNRRYRLQYKIKEGVASPFADDILDESKCDCEYRSTKPKSGHGMPCDMSAPTVVRSDGVHVQVPTRHSATCAAWVQR